MGTSAKPTAACNFARGRAAKAIKSCHPIHWGSKSARAQPAQEQRTATRRHAWGISLFPNAGNIPYSNKAFEATVLSREGTALAASRQIGAKVSKTDLAAQAVGPESNTQPNTLSADQAPMPSAAAGPSSGFANTANAPQQTSFESGHCWRMKSGAERLRTGTGSAPQQGCALRFNQGFWQELQRVLSQLPDHKVTASQPTAAGAQLQEAIAAALDVHIPLTKCQALACLATASFYRSSHHASAGDNGQLPKQAAQQTAQLAAQQTAQQAAHQAAQHSTQQPAQQMPQEAAHPAPGDTCQQSLNDESTLPVQACTHVSMHAMLANARGVPTSPADKLAPEPPITVPTNGTSGQDMSSSSAAELGPHRDATVRPRLESPLLATGPLSAQGGGSQTTAAQGPQAQQQEGHHGNHIAVPSTSLAASPGTLQQATANTQSGKPLQTKVDLSKSDAALGQSEQAARGTVAAAAAASAAPAVADPRQASTAGQATAVEQEAKSPGITDIKHTTRMANMRHLPACFALQEKSQQVTPVRTLSAAAADRPLLLQAAGLVQRMCGGCC